MTVKKTPGERIARKLWADGGITRIAVELWLWKRIDAAIRHAQADAWDDGFRVGCAEYRTVEDLPLNPYKTRRK